MFFLILFFNLRIFHSLGFLLRFLYSCSPPPYSLSRRRIVIYSYFIVYFLVLSLPYSFSVLRIRLVVLLVFFVFFTFQSLGLLFRGNFLISLFVLGAQDMFCCFCWCSFVLFFLLHSFSGFNFFVVIIFFLFCSFSCIPSTRLIICFLLHS